MAKKNISEYFDKYGFIGHFDSAGNLEFGDGLQRIGTYWLEKFDSDPDHRTENAVFLNETLSLVELLDGEYVRHPDNTFWPGQRGTCSRDQIIPVICCLALYSKYSDALKRRKSRLFWNLFWRAGLLWNYKKIGQTTGRKLPDWIGPSAICLFARSSLMAWFFPLTWTLDLFFILNSIALVITALIDKEETGIDLNFQNVCYTQSQFFSPFNWVAKLIYVALRPQPALPGQSREVTGHPTLNVWRLYFWEDNCPPLDIIMQSWVRKWFS